MDQILWSVLFMVMNKRDSHCPHGDSFQKANYNFRISQTQLTVIEGV